MTTRRMSSLEVLTTMHPSGKEIFELHPKNLKEYSRTVILPQIVNQIKIHLSLK